MRLPNSFDFFGLFFIYSGELVTGCALRMEQLIQLSLDRLRIPVLGPLNEEVIIQVPSVAMPCHDTRS